MLALKTTIISSDEGDEFSIAVGSVENGLRIIQGVDVIFLTESQARELRDTISEFLND